MKNLRLTPSGFAERVEEGSKYCVPCGEWTWGVPEETPITACCQCKGPVRDAKSMKRHIKFVPDPKYEKLCRLDEGTLLHYRSKFFITDPDSYPTWKYGLAHRILKSKPVKLSSGEAAITTQTEWMAGSSIGTMCDRPGPYIVSLRDCCRILEYVSLRVVPDDGAFRLYKQIFERARP